jgi:DNA-binding transcriptional MerR regulator
MNLPGNLEKLAKRSRWASIIGLTLVVVALLVSTYLLYTQQQLLERKRAQIKDLNTVIERTQKQVSRYRLAKQAASEAAAASPDTSLTSATVFIHIQDGKQQEIAMAVGARLQAAGFSIPANPILVKESTKSNQVRYFHPDDLNEAKKIVVLLDSMGLPAIMNDLTTEYDKSQMMAARHFELWLGRPAAFF